MRDKEPYFIVKKKDMGKVNQDLALLSWYAILKDYAKRFKKDEKGFIRVPSNAFMEDYSLYHMKIWRYNKKLEDKGLIVVDRASRGGRTWIGYKFI